jgi:hypothetical protein
LFKCVAIQKTASFQTLFYWLPRSINRVYIAIYSSRDRDLILFWSNLGSLTTKLPAGLAPMKASLTLSLRHSSWIRSALYTLEWKALPHNRRHRSLLPFLVSNVVNCGRYRHTIHFLPYYFSELKLFPSVLSVVWNVAGWLIYPKL